MNKYIIEYMKLFKNEFKKKHYSPSMGGIVTFLDIIELLLKNLRNILKDFIIYIKSQLSSKMLTICYFFYRKIKGNCMISMIIPISYINNKKVNYIIEQINDILMDFENIEPGNNIII